MKINISARKGIVTPIIGVPHAHDILCGRGKAVTRHVGNKFLRKLTFKSKLEYKSTSDHQRKREIAEQIISEIESLDPPGRFLISNTTEKNGWAELCHQDAITKTCQALREWQVDANMEIDVVQNKLQSVVVSESQKKFNDDQRAFFAQRKKAKVERKKLDSKTLPYELLYTLAEKADTPSLPRFSINFNQEESLNLVPYSAHMNFLLSNANMAQVHPLSIVQSQRLTELQQKGANLPLKKRKVVN